MAATPIPVPVPAVPIPLTIATWYVGSVERKATRSKCATAILLIAPLVARQAHHAQAQPGRGGGRGNGTGGRGGRGGYCTPIKSFKYDGSHSLSVCPDASPEERERLYDEKFGPRANNSQRQHQQANQANTPPSNPPSESSSSRPTEQANAVVQTMNVGRPSGRGVSWAEANNTFVTQDDNTLLNSDGLVQPAASRRSFCTSQCRHTS